MSRGGKILAGLLVLAAVAGLGWWLLGMQDDDAAGEVSRAATTSSTAGDAELPDAGAPPDAATDAPAPESLTVADSAAAGPDAQPGNAITFTGRVVDPGGRPVKDAEVLHLPSDPMRELVGLDWRSTKSVTPWDRFVSTRTDAQGRFSLPSRELPPHGGAVLDVDTNGKGMTRGGIDGRLPRLLVQHTAFEPKLFNLFAFARGDSNVGDLVVSPCGVVVGRCVDAQGSPLADVPIGLTRTGQPMMDYGAWSLLWNRPRTTSGADGRFVFGGLWNLELNLEFVKPDFVPRREKVTIVAGQTVDLGDVVLDRGGEISGWVVSASGAPIPGARVTLKPNFRGGGEETGPDVAAVADALKISYSGKIYELYATTAQDGSFHFAGVATVKGSPWRLVAAADGYEAAMLDPVEPGDGLRLALAPAGSLLLSIVEPGSATPVAGARVEAHRIAASKQWGDEGKLPLTLSVKPEGEAWRLLGAGAVNDALISAPGHATTGFLLPAVPPGEWVEHRVELPPEAVIVGHVLDEQGLAIPRATLVAQPPSEVPVKLQPLKARTDAQGAFRFGTLCAGEWTLLPGAEGFVVAEPVRLTLKAGEAADDVVVKLARGGSITGRVLTRDPAAAAGLQVLAEPADAMPPDVLRGVAATMRDGKVKADDVKSVKFKAVADDRGEYALRGLPTGTYHVGSWSGDRTDVVVKAGEESHLDISIHEPPRLHGRVTMAGVPVEGAKVVLGDLVLQWFDEIQNTTTDAGGRYELKLLGAGEGYGREVYARFKDWKTRAVKVAPLADQDLQVDLAFPSGAMEGELVDEEGKPVQANVHWHCNAREGFISEADEVNARADTGPDGRFRLEHLPDGTGPLMISKSPYVGIMQDETVRDGGTTVVPRIVMRKGCQLEVHVGGSGNPQDPMQRYLIRVRSVADPTWHGNELHVNFGQTTTFRGIPAGAIEIDVLKPVSPVKFEPLRTVQARVELDKVTRFDQPVDS